MYCDKGIALEREDHLKIKEKQVMQELCYNVFIIYPTSKIFYLNMRIDMKAI